MPTFFTKGVFKQSLLLRDKPMLHPSFVVMLSGALGNLTITTLKDQFTFQGLLTKCDDHGFNSCLGGWETASINQTAYLECDDLRVKGLCRGFARAQQALIGCDYLKVDDFYSSCGPHVFFTVGSSARVFVPPALFEEIRVSFLKNTTANAYPISWRAEHVH